MPFNADSPRGERLLLVDSSPATVTLLRCILESAGYVCLGASNGGEALNLFRHQHTSIAAIITGVHLPVMDGLEFIAAAKNIAPLVKVIIATGDVDVTRRCLHAELKVDAFLQKPFTSALLISRVRSVLAQDA
jgi:CheY-like chemotaxis protein